ncbi:unnamed protein product [Discosporangium mesarthrocarpum]
MRPSKGKTLREFLPLWSGHLTHWVANAGDVPFYAFRYEDLLHNPGEVLR